jgi:hypothetical protein
LIMTTLSEYNKFIKSKGRPLSVINPGSDEVALRVTDAVKAIELLNQFSCPVLGGDILTTDSNSLVYADQHWGLEYHYLNWHCDRKESEDLKDYATRSILKAKEAINEAERIARKLKDECYIVLVI